MSEKLEAVGQSGQLFSPIDIDFARTSAEGGIERLFNPVFMGIRLLHDTICK
jgi:hypothetical protein